MNIWDFMAEHYFFTFLLGIFALVIIGAVLKFISNLWTRFLRCLMVRKHGWPPNHLDADGDWRPFKDDLE